MSQTNYKSARLLSEAANRALEAVRKAAMGNIPLPWDHLNELRDLVEQLAKRANRLALEDVADMEPADYVATMKPVVATFHRQLHVADRLTSCLCEDLKARACVVILIGDDVTTVRAAHDASKPEVALMVEKIVASIDDGTKMQESRCEMILPHHPDCECTICKAHIDPVCDKLAVGFTVDGEHLCRVCKEHAAMVEDDPESYGVLTYYTKRVAAEAAELATKQDDEPAP